MVPATLDLVMGLSEEGSQQQDVYALLTTRVG